MPVRDHCDPEDVKAIQCQELRKSFRSGGSVIQAVAGIDVGIDPGEIVAFLGPNGAGKTTTLDMVLGLTDPSSGSVSVFGDKPRQAICQGKVGAVLQTGGLLRDLTVKETVTAIAAIQGAQQNVRSVMESTGLTDLAARKVSRCSGGEQQRIKFALALLTDPRLLILDEPTAGLDVAARRDFWEAMRHQARDGRTIVFATHYLEEAQQFAERIVLIARGSVIADGPVAEIRALTHRRVVRAVLPPGQADSVLTDLQPMLGTDVVIEGSRLTASTPDSDALALALLQQGASELEITAPSLEDAFLALTEGK